MADRAAVPMASSILDTSGQNTKHCLADPLDSCIHCGAGLEVGRTVRAGNCITFTFPGREYREVAVASCHFLA
jgi:hypothetical protein